MTPRTTSVTPPKKKRTTCNHDVAGRIDDAMRLIRPATMAVAMGLMSLAACQKSPEAVAVENKADMLADDLEKRADNMDMMADTMANDDAAAAIRNAADSVDDAARNVRDRADTVIDNMR